jgi:2-phospho-L-lactate/phosphoenolpyruvate guanylyltransferase
MIWGLVPVNDFTVAKSRLAGVLDDDARAKFARALCQHVLRVLCASPAVDGVLVLTPSAEVARLARARGAEVLRDPGSARAPLGPLVDAALAHLEARGAEAALVLMSDLPRLAPSDIQGMAAALAHAELVVAPDRHQRGTNALGVRLRGRGATCFGHEDSFTRHLAASARVQVFCSTSLGFDVDLPEDLALLRAQAPSQRGGSGTPVRA